MQTLVLEPTTQSQWQALVQEAQASCDHRLDETLESYLVFLLMRFCNQPHCISRIIAEDFLNSQSCTGDQRIERLRDVGDHCLLFSGMFPQLAERRLVRVSYFVNMGRASYRQLSDLLDQGWSVVYEHLSHAFVILMDILHAMRELGGESILTPLQAMELWQETGSTRCYRQLAAGHGIPFAGSPEKH